jgi:hypothetical protein
MSEQVPNRRLYEDIMALKIDEKYSSREEEFFQDCQYRNRFMSA